MIESRRTKMTKLLIRDAFLDLLERTPLDKITVKQICEAADVNRSTFYAHYEDTHQLLREIENDVLEQVPVAENIPAIYTETTYLDMLQQFFKYIRKNEHTFRLLMMSTQGNSFSEKLIKSVFEKYSDREILNDTLRFKYAYIFSINGVIGLVKEWISTGFPIDDRDMAKLSLGMSKQASRVLLEL